MCFAAFAGQHLAEFFYRLTPLFFQLNQKPRFKFLEIVHYATTGYSRMLLRLPSHILRLANELVILFFLQEGLSHRWLRQRICLHLVNR